MGIIVQYNVLGKVEKGITPQEIIMRHVYQKYKLLAIASIAQNQ